MEWWERERRLCRLNRESQLSEEDTEGTSALRACYAGRPFADEPMVDEWGKGFHRTWIRGRPKKRARSAVNATSPDSAQFVLFQKSSRSG
jgi:hypothetical protein